VTPGARRSSERVAVPVAAAALGAAGALGGALWLWAGTAPPGMSPPQEARQGASPCTPGAEQGDAANPDLYCMSLVPTPRGPGPPRGRSCPPRLAAPSASRPAPVRWSPTSAGCSGWWRAGGCQGRSTTSSRFAPTIAGQAWPGLRSRTTVHMKALQIRSGTGYISLAIRPTKLAKGTMRMATFADREKQFETKYRHDEGVRFKGEPVAIEEGRNTGGFAV